MNNEEKNYSLFTSLSQDTCPSFSIKAVEGIDNTGKTTLIQNTSSYLIDSLPVEDIHFDSSGIEILGSYIFLSLPFRDDPTYDDIKSIISQKTPDQLTKAEAKQLFHLFEDNSHNAFTSLFQTLNRAYQSDHPHRHFTIYMDRCWLSGFAYHYYHDVLTNPLANLVRQYHLYPLDTLYYLYPNDSYQSHFYNAYDRYCHNNKQKLLASYHTVIKQALSLGIIKHYQPVFKPLDNLLLDTPLET